MYQVNLENIETILKYRGIFENLVPGSLEE